jgi:hypothetical protein
MLQTVEWGAPPPTIGHNPPATTSELGTTSPLSPSTDATTKKMEYVVAEVPPSKTCVSSEGWTVDKLVGSAQRFRKVPRVSALASTQTLLSAIEDYERSGIPLIIEGWHKHQNWPKDIFSVHWFGEHGQTGA